VPDLYGHMCEPWASFLMSLSGHLTAAVGDDEGWAVPWGLGKDLVDDIGQDSDLV